MPMIPRFRYIASVTVLAVVSTILAPPSYSEDRVQSRPLIVAHRGASHDAPENTLAAFRLAWEQGADVIEGDFYLTSDGHIVCIHDGTTKKTAGVELDVAKSTLAELRQLDVGRWKDERFAGEQIPTIEEVLSIVPEGKAILIEVKCGPEIVPQLKAALAASPLKPEQTIVIAFDDKVVAATKKQIPGIKAYWLTGFKEKKPGRGFKPSPAKVMATLKRIGADGLDTHANEQVIDAEFVKMLRDAGMEFHTWTVNDPAVAARFRELGVDSITTDRPAFLREELNKLPQPVPSGNAP